MLMASSLLTSMLLNLCSYWGYLASDWGSPSSSLNFLRPQSSTSVVTLLLEGDVISFKCL